GGMRNHCLLKSSQITSQCQKMSPFAKKYRLRRPKRTSKVPLSSNGTRPRNGLARVEKVTHFVKGSQEYEHPSPAQKAAIRVGRRPGAALPQSRRTSERVAAIHQPSDKGI